MGGACSPREDAAVELRAEARYRALAAQLPDYVVVIDRERRYRWANRAAPGLTVEELTGGLRIDDHVSDRDRERVYAAIERVFETGEPGEYEIEAYGDGVETAYYLTRMFPGAPEGGEPRVICTTSNVTRQKRLELALRASEQRLARAIGGGNIALWEIDLATGHGEVVGWTSDFLVSRGPTPADAWISVIHAEDRARAVAAFDAFAAGHAASYDCEYRIVHPRTGNVRDVLCRGRVVDREDGRRLAAGTMTDVTALRSVEAEQRALERRLEHVQRLESIGLLAGGVAHDFNNLLTVITSGAECARKLVRTGRCPEQELDAIVEAAMRASSLTQQLLAFGRRAPLALEDVDVASLVRGVGTMVARVFPKNVEIELTDVAEGGMVRADRHRLAQVVLNLCVNARDAMPDGGRVRVSVATEDDEVVIGIADDGVGIPAASRERIFEPFFTTKPVGVGTGLGLSVAHGIVQQHGGSIAVARSEPGRGTLMEVRLPRSGSSGERPVIPRAAPGGGTETILVADDDALVLRAACRTLEDAEYRILSATDGRDAVDRFRAAHDEIDLVLLDVVMPRLDGWKARQEILESAPGARVLLTSGYAASAIPAGRDPASVPLLAKPYGPDVLLRAVREALDAERPIEGASRDRASGAA